VDKVSHLKYFMIINLLLCNACNAAMGFTNEFWQILLLRMLFSVFSAGVDPAMFRLIALYFPPEKRGIALGLFFVAVYIGSAIASLCFILAENVGWRISFVIVALVSTFFTLAAGLPLKNVLNNPESDSSKPSKKFFANIREDARELFKNKTIVFTILGSFFKYWCGFAKGFYEGFYFTSQFSEYATYYSILNAIALIIAPIGPILGGYISDSKEKSNKPRWRPLICAVTNFIPIPIVALMYITETFWLSMLCLFLVYIIGETYISVSFAMMINVTTPRVRALRNIYTESALMISITFIAGSCSTLILGAVNTSTENLQIGLLITTTLGYFLAGVCFYIVSRFYTEDLARDKDTLHETF
jgi:MFS family permease